MRRVLWVIGSASAALMAAATVFVAATLPPRAERFSGSGDTKLIWGAYHVHSTRSDGSGTRDDIAAAAARTGLQFIIFTDHGAATSVEPPQYRHGVLCIDAVEVSTEAGHIVALNLQRPSPYPLAGESRDVIEDIRRLGGWAVVAHPESPRPALRWRAPAGDVDGFEWLNVDSEWRAHSTGAVSAIGLRALIRPPEAIVSLFKEAPRTLERWDARAPRENLFTLAALDAHARIGVDTNGQASSLALRFPGYETLFRAVAQAVSLSRPLSGEPAGDSAAVLAGISAGQSFSVVRGLADGLAPIEFWAANEQGRVALSGRLISGSGRVQIGAEIPDVQQAELALLRNGTRVASGRGPLRFDASTMDGRYRLLAFLPGRPFPWITTNAIDVGGEVDAGASPVASAISTGPTVPVSAWQIEKDPASTATVSASGANAILRYQLGAGVPAGQYAALSAPAGSGAIERIEFLAQASGPLRASLQVRAPGSARDQRWRKSIYLDDTPRQIIVTLAELDPVDRRSPLRPIVAKLQSVLLVIDTVNTRPGASGTVTIRNVRFVEAR